MTDNPRETAAMRDAAITVQPMIDGDKTSHIVCRNGNPLQPYDSSEAAYLAGDRNAEEILESRRLFSVQGQTSRDRAGEAKQARLRLNELVAEVNGRHPGIVPAEVRDGAIYWLGHRFADTLALEGQLLIFERIDERQRTHQTAFEQAVTNYDATTRLSLSDRVDQGRNHRAAWGDQEVDLMVMPTHPAFPTTGTVQLEDGRTVIDTLTRDELAIKLGVPFPETIDERVERNRALSQVREAAQQRAETAAAEARQAAHDAEQAAMAMHHATA